MVLTLSQMIGKNVIKLGDSGPIVKAMQLALARRGYPLTGTGYFGTATDTALTAFQKRAGLTADGECGPRTAAALDGADKANQTGIPAETKAEIARPLWIEAGLQLLGTKEVPGKADNPVILQWAKDEGGDIAKSYTHDSIPFCALGINHILTKAGLKGTETLWALDFADTKKWPSIRLPGPAVGAIAAMTRSGGGHVITVMGRDQHGNIMGLGFNQSDTVSIIPFPLDRLNHGFMWPLSVPLPEKIGYAKLPIVKSDGRVSSNEA
jgi:uncharacterized protein (TIGR02594 family)